MDQIKNQAGGGPKIDVNADVVNQYTGERWYYSDIVKEHFFNPRNLMLEDPDESEYDAVGMVGSPACGDMMRMWLKIEHEGERIKEMKWRTFGCGSAIAATSMFSVMVTENGGLPLGEALKIKPPHIMERLGGLPNRKIHCSVLADKAFRKAANDYFRRMGQHERIIIEGARVIDAKLNITDKDIEEAVLEGAVDLESVQKKLKVGVGSPELIPEIEQLIRFYKEKYYG
jgi:NifU-like protein involved in Fe-S cluster formation